MTHTAASVVQAVEHKSYPVDGRVRVQRAKFRGVHFSARSRLNAGRSGKGFTTQFYVREQRVSRARLLQILEDAQ